MKMLSEESFLCLDSETTGLDSKEDRIIEIACVKFTLKENLETMESLVHPLRPIPEASTVIHQITDSMLEGKPTIEKVLPEILEFCKGCTLVGHAIELDLQFITQEAFRNQIPCNIAANPSIDTLRLARLYGKSPSNSLEVLRSHFHIEERGAHRAMNDVLVNIDVFKQLIKPFKMKKEILKKLEQPILLKKMPLGKYKGRPFQELPEEYLFWASKQNFDQDLLFSLKHALKKKKRTNTFERSSNPFSNL